MDNKEAAISLFKKGMEYKLKGNLEDGKDAFTNSLSNDPTNKEVYYELGKLEFLRGKYASSLNAYFAYTHIQLQNRVKQLNGSLPFPEKQTSEDFYNSLPIDVRNQLPNKAASYIFEDGDICNHVAHSYFGSHSIENQELLNNFKLYYATLVGSHLVQMTIDQFKLSLKKYKNSNLNTFIPEGRLILLDSIDWNNLGSSDVLNIYFK